MSIIIAPRVVIRDAVFLGWYCCIFFPPAFFDELYIWDAWQFILFKRYVAIHEGESYILNVEEGNYVEIDEDVVMTVYTGITFN